MLDPFVSGIVTGAAYSLLAIGYSMIFASMRLMHFAQGDFLMLGGFVALSLITSIGANIVTAIIGVVIVLGLVGLVLERCTYSMIPYELVSPRIIASLGVGMVLRNLATIFWGSRPLPLPDNFFPGSPVQIGSLQVQPPYYWTVVIAFICMIILAFLLTRTKIGLAIRAAEYNTDVCELMGINAAIARSFSFMIGVALAAVAGILVAPMTFIHYEMGVAIGMKGFAAAVLGGLGNIPGAVLGGILLGVFESMGTTFISSGYQNAIAFVILIVILVFKPSGLMNQSEPEKI